MSTKRANGNKHKNKTTKAPKSCTYKKPNGSINVSNYMRCIANDTLRSQLGKPKHIYEINDNAAFPFVVVDYGGGRAAIYNNRFDEKTNRGELKGKLMDVMYEQLFLGDNGTNDPYWIFKRGVEQHHSHANGQGQIFVRGQRHSLVFGYERRHPSPVLFADGWKL